jgi:hypothetical protein
LVASVLMVSIVFRWSLAFLVALWLCAHKSWRCSVMFWVVLMFSWCFCPVLAVFRWCFGGIEETFFFE